MALEDLTGTKYIDDLNSSNPAAGDNVSEGDDHIRGIKNVLKTTFPSIDGAITATDTELNYVDGVTSSIQTQIDNIDTDLVNDTSPQLGGNLDVQSYTVDGVDIATRDGVLTSTTTTANAALPKAGGAMTGAITTNSTFDGRDVATDGTKLDTVETNADVTDTTNVTSAGALMDSEVTNLADVKAFDTTDYATAAQGTTADAALPRTGGGSNAMTGHIYHQDNVKGIYGGGSDLQIYHSSSTSNSYIDDAGTGNVYVRSTNGNAVVIADDARTLARFNRNGSSDLYHSDAVKLATTSGGVQVTGNVGVSGTVDGRDVATDGTKLDGIASSANNYSHPTSAGNKHIPSGGSTNQVLTYSSSGTAAWASPAASAVTTHIGVFDTTGSHSYTVPTGITKVWISGCGGGGHGGYDAVNGGGGAGGNAGGVYRSGLDVTSGSSLSISVGGQESSTTISGTGVSVTLGGGSRGQNYPNGWTGSSGTVSGIDDNFISGTGYAFPVMSAYGGATNYGKGANVNSNGSGGQGILLIEC